MQDQLSLYRFALIAAVIALLAASVFADQKDTRMAITNAADADEDFSIQGEYHGCLRSQFGSLRQVGLQVRALGDGQFAAVEYPGGLPGAGWTRQKKFELTGEREGEAVWLASQQCMFIIDGRCAKAFSVSGRPLGQMQKVTRKSPTLGTPPPRCAQVLFGQSINAFKNGKVTDEGWLKWGTETLTAYRDFQLHIEFRLPYMPYARGQGRANSGVYLQSRYEVQVLDSFSLEGVQNECGALYKTRQPDVNMCLPPLQWQTYDIYFRSPRFAADGVTKICDGRITVVHNGVTIHNNVIVPNKTGAGRKEGPLPLPTKLQDHGNPVVFKNIWIIDHDPSSSVTVARTAATESTAVLEQASIRPRLKILFPRFPRRSKSHHPS